MVDEEKEIQKWIDERRKGSDLMCKLLKKNEELEAKVKQLELEKQQTQEQVKKILLDDNAEIGDLKKVVGMDWYDTKEVEGLRERNKVLSRENDDLKIFIQNNIPDTEVNYLQSLSN